jgi:hypothetical protein
VVQIVVPSVVTDSQREAYQKLSDLSGFEPRPHFAAEAGHAP